jgi:hypothetical protein
VLKHPQWNPTDADVMARYRSCPAVSQICALIVLPSVWIDFVANSTPIVDLDWRAKASSTKARRRQYKQGSSSRNSDEQPLGHRSTRSRQADSLPSPHASPACFSARTSRLNSLRVKRDSKLDLPVRHRAEGERERYREQHTPTEDE